MKPSATLPESGILSSKSVAELKRWKTTICGKKKDALLEKMPRGGPIIFRQKGGDP